MDAGRLGSDRAADRDDDRLVHLARAGDVAAFGELVTRHRLVAARVASLVAPAADLDDVLQEACVKAWQAMPRFRAGAPFRPWWCRIVANEAKNRMRATHRREALHLRHATVARDRDDRTPEAAAIARDEAEALARALGRVPSEDRLVIGYRWLLDLDHREMADALAIPVGTVKSRLSRAMARLRAELLAEGNEP